MGKRFPKMKIFIGPWETAGYYKGLSAGLLESGREVMFVLFHDHPFAYGGETHRPAAIRLARGIARLRPDVLSGFLSKVTWWSLTLAREVLLTTWSLIPIFKCDAFIFGTGNSFWRNNLDLPLLRLLRKKVILNVAHGGELRPPYLDGSYQSKDGSPGPNLSFYKKRARQYRRKIQRIERYRFLVVGSPMSSSQFASRAMTNVFNLGIPTHLDVERDVYPTEPNASRDEVRILHAPSHPAAKGSFEIREAISTLQNEGLKILYREISGAKFDVVRNSLVWCDFVVDQVYSDTPLAGLGSEAAMLGKPSVVSGFGLSQLMQIYPAIDFPVSLVSAPSGLEASIRRLAIDKKFRLQIGREAQKFVLTHWSPRAVAERFLKLIEDQAPEDWTFSPGEFHYFEGYGQDEATTKRRIKKLVARYGISSLQLDHKPLFRDELLDWAFEFSVDS